MLKLMTRGALAAICAISLFSGIAFGSANPVISYGISPDGTANNVPQVTPPSGSGAATNGGSMQVNTEGLKATYTASVTGFSPVAAATDFLNIFGSSTKTIRITRIEVSATTTAATAAVNDLVVLKRSTAGTLGSAALTALTAVKHDSANGTATAVISTVGTANYTTLGTLIGNIQARKLVSGLATATATDFPVVPAVVWTFTDRNEQGIVLRGTGQQLALNLAGGTVPTGASFDVSVTWTEE